MNTSQMKNIIVLKDLPSNMIDEAIVILKNNNKVKKKEKVENQVANCLEDIQNDNSDLALKEAELIIQKYIEDTEKPKNMKQSKYKIAIFLFGLAVILGIIISIIR